MELSLTTFLLEIVNFLVLVWILKRLFFAPVKKAIEGRRAEIKKSLEEAANARAEADKLRSQYENRLKDWEIERAAKLDALRKELDVERDRRIGEIGVLETKERERLRAQEEKTRAETKERQEREAIQQSLAFLSKLLTGLASKEVETGIVRMFLKRWKEENNARTLFARENEKSPHAITIHSAYPLNDTEKALFLEEFPAIPPGRPPFKFAIDESLLAGVEITVGALILRANLRDELRFFSEVAADGF